MMPKIVTFFLTLAISANVFAQNMVTKVNYKSVVNGKADEGRGLTIRVSDNVVSLTGPGKKIRDFIDYNEEQTVTILSDGNKLFKTSTPFKGLPQPVLGSNRDSVMGFNCSYAVINSFSNKIEVWFTDKAGVKGSPYLNYIPDCHSLVLKVTINGNRTYEAISITNDTIDTAFDYPVNQAQEVSAAEMEELKINSRFTSVKVFQNQTINFESDLAIPAESEMKPRETYRFSKGSVVLKKVVIPETVKNTGQVFARLECWSDGDAYDRTGSVFIIPDEESKTTIKDALLRGVDILPVFTDRSGQKYQGFISNEVYDPPVEIMRFFTSFGARFFNSKRVINNYPWKDAAFYNQEVTRLFPSGVREIWVGVFIGNYDKGGHKINLDLNFYPSFEDEKPEQSWIHPLFYTVNVMEMSGQNYGRLFKTDTLKAEFIVPDSISDLQLLFTSTGHGGWGGGDEFNPKTNRVFIDGKLVFDIVPWRTDCATYRLVNPSSGNFGNGLSSSDLSRSNWCPGTVTPPYIIPLRNLPPGKHTVQVAIDQGNDEGGSFNAWSVSGTLTGTFNRMP